MTERKQIFASQGSAGVTQPQDARLALMGLLYPDGPTPLDALTGFLSAPGNPVAVTGNSTGPNMQYDIGAGHLVTQRGGNTDGVMLWCNDGPVTKDSGAPSPSSGSRWDLIYAVATNANDGAGDPTTTTKFGVAVGDANATPSKPTSLVPAGAVVIAQALIPAHASSAADSGVTISRVLRPTVARGGLLPVGDSTRYPSNPYVGQAVYDAALDRIIAWNANGTAKQYAPADTIRAFRNASASLSAGQAFHVSSWDGGIVADVGDGWAYSGAGIFTATRSGEARFDYTALFGSTTPGNPTQLQAYVEVNGSATVLGRSDGNASGLRTICLSSGSPFHADPGTTVQLVIVSFDQDLTAYPKSLALSFIS